MRQKKQETCTCFCNIVNREREREERERESWRSAKYKGLIGPTVTHCSNPRRNRVR